MRRLPHLLTAAALLLAASCDKSAPPPTTTPETTTTPPVEQAEVEDPAADPEQAKADEEAKKKAEAEKKLAERLAKAEEAAAKKKARWTPELIAEYEKLVAKKQTNTNAALKKIAASKHRTEGAADRDKYRHPAKTLAFFGIKPNWHVFEVGQGAGWYTELLAPLLARDGKLYLAGYDANSADPNVKFNARQTELFIEGGGKAYEAIELVTQPPGPEDPVAFGPDESLDAILVFRMFHNIHRAGLYDRMLPSAYAALKPGGVLAVVQHRAPKDSNPDDTAPKGYIPEAWLITKIESYGFKLDKKSEINANPKDTKDYEKGVWTLPPVLAEGDKDKDKYVAIGESDRMTLRFIKPKNAAKKDAKAAAKDAKADAKADKADAKADKKDAKADKKDTKADAEAAKKGAEAGKAAKK